MEAVVVAEEGPRSVIALENVSKNGVLNNRIQVSSSKKPVRFYVNLAKKIMNQHNEVVLSALGRAIGTVVSISEILKSDGWATEKKISTSTIESKAENKGRLIHKARLEILLGRGENFDDLVNGGKKEESSQEQTNLISEIQEN
ncbi:uncharacterized protein At2g34160-like [Wolffia australiana]